MSDTIHVTIDGRDIAARAGQTLLAICREQNIPIPTLCEFDGLASVGACRLCLVEMEGTPKLFPACTTPVQAGQKIRTVTEKLQKYRKMIIELFFSERNHICAVCVANQHCDLQNLAVQEGVSFIRFPYLFQKCELDASHKWYVMDHNRCIMCTRCVRVCDEVEGAHNWDVTGRGYKARVIADFNQPWGESVTCTSCSKCIQVCPTGALWPKSAQNGRLAKQPEMISELAEKRGRK